MPSPNLLFALLIASAAWGQVRWELLSSAAGRLPVPGAARQQTASLAFDADADGITDFFIASRREGSNVVWYRRAAWGWSVYLVDGDHLPIEAGGAAMDVDRDGDLDLIFGEDASGNKVWWWENPRPNYDPAVPWKRRAIKAGGANKHHDQLVGDFDGDGDNELIFWNQGKGGRKLVLARVPADVRNAASWPLTEIFSWSEGDYEGLAAADIDGDGRRDIVGGGMWFRHRGGDSFEPRVIDPGQGFSRAAAGQLKKGGPPEVVFAPGDRDGPLIWYELNGGKWVAHELESAVVHGHSLDIGDVDKDGNLDILCGEMRKWGPPDNSGARLWVYYGDGKGNFKPTELPRGNGHHEARLADLDGDGRLDILDKPYIWGTPAVNVWLNRPAPARKLALDRWRRHVVDSARPWRAVFVYPADVDCDGRPDIVAGGWWYRNPGSAGGEWVRNTIGAPLNNVAAVFDLDNDGRPDLLGTGWKGPAGDASFHWARNNGGGSLTVHENAVSGEGDFLQGAAAARMAAGGGVEVALSWHQPGRGLQMLAVPADPARGKWQWRRVTDVTQDEQVTAGDIDRDGRLDLLLGTRWLRNGEDGWTPRTVSGVEGDPDRNRLADLNGDGRLDAVVGFESISKPGKVAWFEQPADAAGEWREHVMAADVVGPMSLDVADMDADGDLDVVVGEHNLKQPATARLLILENADGKAGRWLRHVASTGDEHHDGAQVADMDGDGDLDILSIGWGHPRVLLYENKAVDAARSAAEEGGRFLREHWYKAGIENGNPVSNRRFRVNAPEAVLHPSFGSRSEVKSSGMLQIEMREDLALLEGADLYVELWGGHPGTSAKRVTPNGRTTYAIPETGTRDGHCTHQYAALPLKLTDLVSGFNAVQFACDGGSSFWGHYIVEGAALRAVLKQDHPDLAKAGLTGFRASVKASPVPGREALRLSLEVAGGQERVAAVRFQGFYSGYGENGVRSQPDWHGYTIGAQPYSYLGERRQAPFAVDWDVSMLPDQQDMAVRAFVTFRGDTSLVYVTEPHRGVRTPERSGARVQLLEAGRLPAPFVSRVGRRLKADIPLNIDPASIVRAQLHVAVWDGGCGTIERCVSLNGVPMPVTGKGRHDVIYSAVELRPGQLRKGANVVEVMSDTEHHGVEILLPGPALMIRTRAGAAQAEASPLR